MLAFKQLLAAQAQAGVASHRASSLCSDDLASDAPSHPSKQQRAAASNGLSTLLMSWLAKPPPVAPVSNSGRPPRRRTTGATGTSCDNDSSALSDLDVPSNWVPLRRSTSSTTSARGTAANKLMLPDTAAEAPDVMGLMDQFSVGSGH